MLLYELLLLLLLQVALIDAVHLCPLLGPSWPAPTGLSSDATVQAALKNITQTLQNASNAGKFSGASLSLEIFDTTSSDALLAYAYTAKEINTTLGVSKVDENTVFRIGSTSKMFPMFLLLIQSGFDTLQDPISKYIPEIKAAGADIQQFFDGLFQSHPIVPPSTTPIYSNAAFQILGYVVEALAGGEDFEKVLKDKITKPLNMAHTFYTTPDSSLGVIPSYQGKYWWDFDIGEEAPAGGIFSSAKDMSTFGRAILNSTLLPRSTTRRWLKPITHTSSLDYAVGAPWEILSFGNERPIDLYTKSGDIGTYSCVLSLNPDHNAGFVLLGAGNSTHVSLALASDLVAESLLPALEQASKNQAHARFAGTYALGTGNSSISITTDDGPALAVTSWVNNGTNMLPSYMALNGITDPSMLDIRLYPTGLESPGQLSFRAVIPPPLPSGVGPFSSSCISWVTVDSQVYGNVGIDEFVFNLDGKGNAVSVSPRVLRTVLSKIH
ncbi:hypothetical protein PoHVEF18_006891 [Penicillium ochrochloron]